LQSTLAGTFNFLLIPSSPAARQSARTRYGFAEENELENAGADYIVENVQDIITTLDEM